MLCLLFSHHSISSCCNVCALMCYNTCGMCPVEVRAPVDSRARFQCRPGASCLPSGPPEPPLCNTHTHTFKHMDPQLHSWYTICCKIHYILISPYCFRLAGPLKSKYVIYYLLRISHEQDIFRLTGTVLVISTVCYF